MNGGAWEALRSLSTVAEIAAALLSSPPAPPESADSLRAKAATGTYAMLGPALLEDGSEEFGTRRLRCECFGSLEEPAVRSVTVHAVALFWQGQPVAVVDVAPVTLDAANPEFLVYIDWTVTTYSEGGQ